MIKNGMPVRYYPITHDLDYFKDTIARSDPFVSDAGYHVIFLKGIS
jgi:hypothetical protein